MMKKKLKSSKAFVYGKSVDEVDGNIEYIETFGDVRRKRGKSTKYARVIYIKDGDTLVGEYRKEKRDSHPYTGKKPLFTYIMPKHQNKSIQ